MMTIPIGLCGFVATAASSSGACRTYSDMPAANAEWTAKTRKGTALVTTAVTDFLMAIFRSSKIELGRAAGQLGMRAPLGSLLCAPRVVSWAEQAAMSSVGSGRKGRFKERDGGWSGFKMKRSLLCCCRRVFFTTRRFFIKNENVSCEYDRCAFVFFRIAPHIYYSSSTEHRIVPRYHISCTTTRYHVSHGIVHGAHTCFYEKLEN